MWFFKEIFWEQVGLDQSKPWLKSQLVSSLFSSVFVLFLVIPVQGGLNALACGLAALC
jgi:hypothetical protein